jgi:hypothetical protein
VLIRSVLVPAIMHRIGPANWAMPVWLGRIVPNLSVEATDDATDPSLADELTPIPVDDLEPADTPVLASVSSSNTTDE